MIKILIILFLLIIITYLYKKTEYFGTLISDTSTKYLQNKNNVISGNNIVLNPLLKLNIQNDLSANSLSAFDISATSINTINFPIDSNDVYNKFSLNTNIISQIKDPSIKNTFSYNKKNNYMYDPDFTYIYENIATYKNTVVDISGYTNGHDVSGWFGRLTMDASGFNTGFVDDVKTNNVWGLDWENFQNNNVWGNYIYQITPNNIKRGIKLTIPNGCNVLWIAILSNINQDRYTYVSICDINNRCYGIYGGSRNLNSNITPGGFISTTPYDSWLTWIAIPLYWLRDSDITNRKVILNCYYGYFTDFSRTVIDDTIWIAKCAFSSNPWNHVSITPGMIIHQLNSIIILPENNAYAKFQSLTNPANLTWWSYTTTSGARNTNDWYGSNIIKVTATKSANIRIPIIKSGKNKLLYFVTLNTGGHVESLQVSVVDSNSNLVKLPNLRTTYTNPFSRHFNSRIHNIYRATIIPDSLIKIDSFGRTFITINMFAPAGTEFWFKELGTHDEN